MSEKSIAEVVRQTLRQFLDSTGRTKVGFDDKSNLLTGLGLTSDEGIDFAIELSAAIQVELPLAFNPFVHDSGTRGCTVKEMIKRVELVVANVVPA